MHFFSMVFTLDFNVSRVKLIRKLGDYMVNFFVLLYLLLQLFAGMLLLEIYHIRKSFGDEQISQDELSRILDKSALKKFHMSHKGYNREETIKFYKRIKIPMSFLTMFLTSYIGMILAIIIDYGMITIGYLLAFSLSQYFIYKSISLHLYLRSV